MITGIFEGDYEGGRNYPWKVHILLPSNVVRVTNNQGRVFTDDLIDITRGTDSAYVPGYRQFILKLLKQSTIINYKGDL